MDSRTGASGERRPNARRVISSLRKGVPPADHLDLYTVGRDELLSYFDGKLAEIREFGLSDVKFIQADFGGGKTHFFHLLTDLALSHNFVVSEVALHPRELPFDKLDIVIRRIVASIVTPSRGANGLEDLLNKWAATQKGRSSDAMYEGLQDLRLFPDFRLNLVEYARARNDTLGIRHEASQRILKWFRGEETPSKHFKSVEEYLAALIALIRHLHFSGFIILLDESEAITSLSRISNRDLANENIRQIIDNDDGTEGFYFVFASTPTFLSGEGVHGAQEYDALWRRISPALGYLELGSLESPIIDLPALSEDELQRLSTRIKELYEVAYEVELLQVTDAHIAALVGYVERRATQRNIRALVRSTVAMLDEARRDSTLDPTTKYEALVETILKEESELRAR